MCNSKWKRIKVKLHIVNFRKHISHFDFDNEKGAENEDYKTDNRKD